MKHRNSMAFSFPGWSTVTAISGKSRPFLWYQRVFTHEWGCVVTNSLLPSDSSSSDFQSEPDNLPVNIKCLHRHMHFKQIPGLKSVACAGMYLKPGVWANIAYFHALTSRMLPPISDTEQFTSEGGPARPMEPRPHMSKRQRERATYLLWHYSSMIGINKKKKGLHAFVDRTRKGVWLSGSDCENLSLDCLRRGGYLLPTHLGGFPGGTSGKEPTCQSRRHVRCRLDS